MNTKWNSMIFLFLICVGAAIMLNVCLKYLLQINKKHTSLFTLVAAVSSLSAVAVTVIGLNSPAKIVNILARPAAGLSSAIIMQLIFALFAVVFFAQRNNSTALKPLSIAGILMCVLTVFFVCRLHMVMTRPAWNTPLLIVLMLLFLIQLGWTYLNGRSTKLSLINVCLCGAALLSFVVRLNMLPKQDRIMPFDKLISGDFAPVFWAVAVLSFLIPLLLNIIMLKKNRKLLIYINKASCLAGLLMLCILMSQLPVSTSVNNRIFF